MTINNKLYWKNLAVYYIAVVLFVFVMGYSQPEGSPPQKPDYFKSLAAVGVFTIFYTGHSIALSMSKEYTDKEQKLIWKLQKEGANYEQF